MSLDDALATLRDPTSSLEARVAAAHALERVGDPRLRDRNPVVVSAGTLLHKPTNESPVTPVAIGAFAIARYPVTVGEFAEFIEAGGYEDPSLWSPEGWAYRLDEDVEAPRFWAEAEWAAYLVSNHPVVGVSAFEAEAYASFREARLPTELEWERAARGDDARDYPWGDAWDPEACGHREHGPRCTVPVGIYPRGVSPLGVHDLCGSVWQWTADERPATSPHGHHRAVRGGAWNNLPWSIGCAGRNAYPPEARFSNLGFRLAFDVR
jgi:iron(II)-dependent oxidoreductase